MRKDEKIKRMKVLDERWLLGNPIVEVDIFGKGGYKNIINQLSYADYKTIVIKEYNKKIVKYCEKKDINVEDEEIYLPRYFEKKFRRRFESFGPIDLGMIFEQEDAKLAEKIVMRIIPFCRFLTLPDYPRCRRVAERAMESNGLKINLDNSLANIDKKCDIILDVRNLECKVGKVGEAL